MSYPHPYPIYASHQAERDFEIENAIRPLTARLGGSKTWSAYGRSIRGSMSLELHRHRDTASHHPDSQVRWGLGGRGGGSAGGLNRLFRRRVWRRVTGSPFGQSRVVIGGSHDAYDVTRGNKLSMNQSTDIVLDGLDDVVRRV
jgi:hypothetical protein